MLLLTEADIIQGFWAAYAILPFIYIFASL